MQNLKVVASTRIWEAKNPNQPDFPSVTLNPNEKYNSKTTYKFKIKE